MRVTKFRTGLATGLALGFYAGTWAGRARFEQINKVLRRLSRTGPVEAAGGKAKAVVDLGVERAKDIVDAKLGRDHATGDSTVDAGVGIPASGFDQPPTFEHTTSPTGGNGQQS
jgi:hypothetical protein